VAVVDQGPAGSVTGVILTASDDDAGINADLSFAIVDTAANLYFEV
jgi:hypothetical protein